MNTSIRDEQLALQKLILDAARDFEDKTGMTIYGEIRIVRDNNGKPWAVFSQITANSNFNRGI